MEKKKCIFVIGPESSGSTLLAQIISAALNGDQEWSGRGFNCCNKGKCDADNGYMFPHEEVEHLVCHRSMPFLQEAVWPPIEKWKEHYDATFVISTRDTTISKLSVVNRFNRSPETVEAHQERARKDITQLLKEDSKTFLFSYETFMYLGDAYIQELYQFLGIKSDYMPESLRDGNLKYVSN